MMLQSRNDLLPKTGKPTPWKFAIVAVLLALPIGAEEASASLTSSKANEGKRASKSETLGEEAPWRNQWFFFWGPANVHARLKESEAEINHKINDTAGRIVPGWNRPTTFKDWSDQFKLWDLHFGLGRDISPKWTWFVDTGGIIGSVKNRDSYWFYVVPLKTKIDFARDVWFLACGVEYYPWGKPRLDPSAGSRGLTRSLKSTKPFMELAAGHVHAKDTADVKLSIPKALITLKQHEELRHDANYISPRLGVEVPLDSNDSVTFEAGYLFFDEHPSDFNNISLYLLHHHRF